MAETVTEIVAEETVTEIVAETVTEETVTIRPVDLQLFAGEKTEQATPKRRQEARKKGQVLRSQEITSALVLLLTFVSLRYLFPYIFGEVHVYTSQMLATLPGSGLELPAVYRMMWEAVFLLFRVALPVMAVAMVAGLLANYMQVGFLLTTETIQFKLDRLNPLEGCKRIFSKRAFFELFKSLWKVGVVGYLMYATIRDNLTVFPLMLDMELWAAAALIGDITFTLVWRAGLLLLALAAADYLYQRYEHEKALRMSKQEVKEEYKEIEGDPQLKGKIKERQRLLAQRRMMQEVPKADVVITNPTHLAVALRYEDKKMAAPVVVAKGQDLLAERIKEIARKHDVAIVENKPLAQTLYRTVDLGQAVPRELYQAVAEILAFVYRLKKKRI